MKKYTSCQIYPFIFYGLDNHICTNIDDTKFYILRVKNDGELHMTLQEVADHSDLAQAR